MNNKKTSNALLAVLVSWTLKKGKSLDKQHGSFSHNSLFNQHIMEISTVIAD